MQRAAIKLVIGAAICAVISDPLVDSVSNFSTVRPTAGPRWMC